MAKSSKAWLQRHVNDQYVKKAKAQGYRSRAAFKLLELDDKERLLRAGMTVVDLGASPGRLVPGGGEEGRAGRPRVPQLICSKSSPSPG
jgi:23S rRNA (uridine2552-2'-O)-methyltransferase